MGETEKKKEPEQAGGKKKNPHAGHRERQKDKFLRFGLEPFSEVEALELLLYYSISRQDTNELAHALLDAFHDIRGVINAHPKDLQRVQGVGEHTAILLSLVGSLYRRHMKEKLPHRTRLRTAQELGEYFFSTLSGRPVETVYLLCLDENYGILGEHDLGEGGPARVEPSVRRIVELALRDRAVQVVISHNHVSSPAMPSRDDVESTRSLYHALALIQVELLDHIIVSVEEHISMRNNGFFAAF